MPENLKIIQVGSDVKYWWRISRFQTNQLTGSTTKLIISFGQCLRFQDIQVKSNPLITRPLPKS